MLNASVAANDVKPEPTYCRVTMGKCWRLSQYGNACRNECTRASLLEGYPYAVKP